MLTWFFWWKTYDDSRIATTVSCIGSFIVTIGSFLLAYAVTVVIPAINEWFAPLIAVPIFFILKTLLNKWTDRIASKRKNRKKQKKRKHIHRIPASMTVGANAVLEIPASLTIVCDRSVIEPAVPTVIYLNDKKAASVENGESAAIPLLMRYNVLQTNSGGFYNAIEGYRFEARSGARGVIHVKEGIFNKKNAVWR
ncbi:MAG: hypothetical protein LBH95_07860 [Oscillospiraceae bacterium]|jgi:hypothetical protein|nr:hypothetical protein [Oscillospiraceae bacterium]